MINQKAPYLVFLFVFGFSNFCFSQFEGKVYYEMTYESNDPETLTFIDMLPKQSTMSIKGTQMRLNQSLAGGGSQAFITNSDLKTSILLMKFMGQEFQVKMNEMEMLKLEKAESFKIVDGTKTKVIAGYTCNQAFALSGKDSLEIYYAPELRTLCVLPQFADLKGIPLQYEIAKGKMRISFQCSSVSVEKIDQAVFTVDESIKQIPFEQFAQSFAVSK
ncbi:hypothetical protein G3O08_06625 [Cryomorpha ignava]|uniref:DUF4412 domain-containing protein n=1 Tax=Cryomorpha ignava TaxID=101383 RepID=A0A7K3WQL2_9FLAO|nr:hypothetical protein [Cryomorpha ignava]NEN23172.1 hypothetical protein [Cryomorpha ignava]